MSNVDHRVTSEDKQADNVYTMYIYKKLKNKRKQKTESCTQ